MTAATEIRPYQPGAPAPRATHISQSTAVEQSRAIAEVQAAVVVAQSCPRDMAEAEREMEYVCGRLDMAEQAFYQVTNRGTGPSVHLARELARIWGNIDYGVKELHRDDEKGISEVLAFAWDVQKNSRSSRTFINPHQRMKQGSRVDLVDLQDIYLSNQNIGARAVRETIFTILPRWFVEKAQNICHNTLKHGEGKPLQERIAALVNAFKDIGVSESQLEARVGRARGTWTPEDLAQLTVAGQSIKRGEAQRDDLFPPIEATTTTADEIATPEPEKKTRTRKPRGAAKTDENTDAVSGETPNEKQQETRAWDGDTNEVNEAGASDKPADPDPGAAMDTPEPEPDPAPEPAAPARERGKLGDAIVKRLFALLNEIKPPLERDDRITVYRAILERPEIQSTNDLSDPEVGKICDQLFKWSQYGGTVLDDRIRDIVNNAAIAEENAKGDNQS